MGSIPRRKGEEDSKRIPKKSVFIRVHLWFLYSILLRDSVVKFLSCFQFEYLNLFTFYFRQFFPKPGARPDPSMEIGEREFFVWAMGIVIILPPSQQQYIGS